MRCGTAVRRGRHCLAELEEALRGLPLREYFGGIGLEEILGLIFGEDGENEGH